MTSNQLKKQLAEFFKQNGYVSLIGYSQDFDFVATNFKELILAKVHADCSVETSDKELEDIWEHFKETKFSIPTTIMVVRDLNVRDSAVIASIAQTNDLKENLANELVA